jgi:hypothetical protein
VPTKALYRCFSMMTSPARGAVAGWISAPGEPSARMAPLAIFGDEMANSPRSLPSAGGRESCTRPGSRSDGKRLWRG